MLRNSATAGRPQQNMVLVLYFRHAPPRAKVSCFARLFEPRLRDRRRMAEAPLVQRCVHCCVIANTIFILTSPAAPMLHFTLPFKAQTDKLMIRHRFSD